jgi:hypothetical protein
MNKMTKEEVALVERGMGIGMLYAAQNALEVLRNQHPVESISTEEEREQFEKTIKMILAILRREQP